jgi:hypothetical protein
MKELFIIADTVLINESDKTLHCIQPLFGQDSNHKDLDKLVEYVRSNYNKDEIEIIVTAAFDCHFKFSRAYLVNVYTELLEPLCSKLHVIDDDYIDLDSLVNSGDIYLEWIDCIERCARDKSDYDVLISEVEEWLLRNGGHFYGIKPFKSLSKIVGFINNSMSLKK